MSTYIANKKAHFNFEILEEFEAGIVLYGHEAKSVRAGKGKLEGGHVLVRGGGRHCEQRHVANGRSEAPEAAERRDR